MPTFNIGNRLQEYYWLEGQAKETVGVAPFSRGTDHAGNGWIADADGQWIMTHIAGITLSTDAISLSGNAQASIALSITAAQSAALPSGVYDVWATNDCYIKVNATANDVTVATGYLLRAGNTISIVVPTQEKIGAIVASGTGTLYYHRVK